MNPIPSLPAPLLERLRNDPIRSVDVGARGGMLTDLEALAPVVWAVAIEPDPGAHASIIERLAAAAWQRYSLIEKALAASPSSEKLLKVYRARGCSSFLHPNPEVVRKFSREEWFHLDDEVPVATSTLDAELRAGDIGRADHLKIDVQGFESEVLAGGADTLETTLALRMEVHFQPLYRDQELYEDLALSLRKAGFFLARFLELRHWRRTGPTTRETRSLPPVASELMHGDALFLRRTDSVAGIDPDARLRAALIAAAYGHLDYGAQILRGADSTAGVERCLESLARRYWRTVRNRRLTAEMKGFLRSLASDAKGLLGRSSR